MRQAKQMIARHHARPTRSIFPGWALPLAGMLALLLPCATQAEQVRLFAAKDSPIYGADGGGAGVDFANHSNGAGYTLYVGTNGTGSPRRSLLQFDFSTLPPGAVVTAATLTLTVDREPNASNQLLSLHVVTSPWTTGTSNSDVIGTPGQGAPVTANDTTWFYASWPKTTWQTPGGDFRPAVVASTWVGPMGPNFSPLPYTWSGQGMINSINTWIQRPASNFGWLMSGNETQTQSVKRFISREAVDTNGNPMNAELLPHLDITYIISSTPPDLGDEDSGKAPVTPSPWGKLRRRILLPRPVDF